MSTSDKEQAPVGSKGNDDYYNTGKRPALVTSESFTDKEEEICGDILNAHYVTPYKGRSLSLKWKFFWKYDQPKHPDKFFTHKSYYSYQSPRKVSAT